MRLHLPRSVGNSNSYQLYRTALNLPRGQPGFFLALHTLGEYFDFHPHFHALVADGLVDEAGECHPAPELPTRVLEELLRARIFAQLLRHKLISKELLAKMKTRKHSGFNVHIGRTVATEDRAANVQVESGVFRPMCLGAVGRIPRGAIGENGKTKVAAPRDSTGGGLNLFANNCQPSNLRKCLESSFFCFFAALIRIGGSGNRSEKCHASDDKPQKDPPLPVWMLSLWQVLDGWKSAQVECLAKELSLPI